MDSIITFIILLVISGIAALLKKKAQSNETENPPSANRSGRPESASAPRPQRQAASWEEELRRLLEGESPVAPPPMRPPPPIVAAPLPRRAPAPLPVNPPLRSVPKPRINPIPVPSLIEVSAEPLVPMDVSRQAYDRGRQLDTAMSARINRVPGEHVQLTAVVRKPISPEVTQVVSLFKNARTARQAVLASIILGPPTGLEQPSTLF